MLHLYNKFPILNLRYILTLACYTHAKSASLKSLCIHYVTMPALELLNLEELVIGLQPSHFCEKPTSAKKQFILLLFSPILLPGNSFFLTYCAQDFAPSFNILLKVKLYS